ncbi:hypothetical protein [Sporisorium scitamineum]|uniref:Mig1 protein, induced during biotrophic phase n=2 Tax=Sporisorium scitamineum TaxID=49012 RepID=A0A0F7S8P4_9BASI|nr:hypothetical protein [Sporisorium scitamineum]
MWSYSLANVNVTMGDSKIAPDDHFLMKDGWKTDFTVKDPTKPFTLSWAFNSVAMSYSDYDEKKGCFKIQLKHNYDNLYRIWVSDEDGSDKRDLDTLNYDQTDKTLCTKWLHIHVKEDGKESD